MELPSEYVETKKQLREEVEQHFHVLAVDDSVIDRKVLATLLQKVSSYRVTCVDSGDKALKYLGLLDDIDNASSSSFPESSQHEGSIKVNLIMTDYCMPGMSGYDLLKRLKGSSWKDVPVVVMSSENVPSRINMCLEGGAEEFLLKPIQLSDLVKLQPYLSKSSDQSEQEGSHSSTATTINNEDYKNDNEDNSSNDNNSGCSKRKAMSPEPESERRPKTK